MKAESIEKSTVCMAKSQDCRPKRLNIVAIYDDTVELADQTNSNPNAPLLRFSRAIVFEFEEELFARLSAAYGKHDKTRLADLWKRATPLGSEP